MNLREEKRKKKDEKLKKIMREIMEYDLESGDFQHELLATVFMRNKDGSYALKNIEDKDLIDFVLMPNNELNEMISFKSNQDFYEVRERFMEMYKEKAEKELNLKYTEKGYKCAFWSMILGGISIAATIVIACIS